MNLSSQERAAITEAFNKIIATLGSIRRGALLLRLPSGEFSEGGVHNCSVDDISKQGSMSRGLLEMVAQSRKARLIEDTRQEPAYAGIVEREFASAVCVPLLESGRLVGLFFADAAKPYAFKHEHVRSVQRHLLSLRLMPVEVAVAAKAATEKTTRWLSVCLLLILLMVALAARSVTDPAPPPTPATRDMIETAAPAQVAGSFSETLLVGEFSGAYGLLTENWRRRLNEGEFKKTVQGWLRSPQNVWELRNRFPKADPVLGSTVRVTLEAPGRGNPWVWKLIKEEGGWKIAGIQGGPLEAAAQIP